MKQAIRTVIVAVTVFAAPLTGRAQASTVPTGHKDAGTATLLGILIPGGGHFYAEEGARGALILGGAVAVLAAGNALRKDEVRSARLVDVPRTSSNPLGLDWEEYVVRPARDGSVRVGIALAAGIWAIGAWDAGRAARRANALLGGRVTVLTSVGTRTRLGAVVTF